MHTWSSRAARRTVSRQHVIWGRMTGMTKDWIARMNALGKSSIPFVFILDFALQKPLVLRADEVDMSTLRYNLRGVRNGPQEEVSVPALKWNRHPVDFQEYKKAFDQVMEELRYGNSFLLNLTMSTPVEVNMSLSEIYAASRAKYKLYLADRFVVFSPETFVRIENGRI